MTESLTVLTGEMRGVSVRRLQSELTSKNSRNVKMMDMMDSPVGQTAEVTFYGAGVTSKSHVRLIPAHTTQPVRRFAVTPLYGEISAVIMMILKV